MIKNHLILFFFIFNLSFAQEDCKSKMYTIKFTVIEKTMSHIAGPFIEILSGNKRISFVSGDFEGLAETLICSEKIKKNSITLKVYGMESVPKTVTHKITSDTTIQIEVDYGKSPFNNVSERQKFISKAYKIPFCGLGYE